MDTSPRDRFLALCPSDRARGIISNLFLRFGPRDGITDPRKICQAVWAAINIHLQTPDDESRAEVYLALRAVLKGNRAASVAMAEYSVRYEALPAAEKRALKAKRSEVYTAERKAAIPASAKQINMLRSLGYRGAVNSMQQASEVISSRLRLRGGVR